MRLRIERMEPESGTNKADPRRLDSDRKSIRLETHRSNPQDGKRFSDLFVNQAEQLQVEGLRIIEMEDMEQILNRTIPESTNPGVKKKMKMKYQGKKKRQ